MTRLVRLLSLCAFALALNAAPASALDYPVKPVRIVVAFPPGGATDILARIMGAWLSERLGQQFIVENKPGAGGNIGTEAVVNAPPDGYTLLLVSPGNAINQSLYRKMPFVYGDAITPVAGLISIPNVMEVHPSVPVKTVKEFIDYVKANPGKVNMASSGNGTSIHLSGELFKAMTGVQMTHIPYRGSAPALTDLLAGQVQVMFDNLPPSIQHIRGGGLRALAVTTAQRAEALPDVPTVAETVPGYEASGWFGLAAPKGTPPDVIALLNREANAAFGDAKIKAKLADLGGTPMLGTPETFGKWVADETVKWEKVVKVSGAQID